ncbi:hypothetical protein PRZ48_010065 [Zasmidium cellare]|uniref:Heterokaryon incompatibility domain-containing protein n=1 Tax=Zasmidium cellare TaxID=395010 RepID=A0ABR0EDH0_ZASCE|nr:hypothetical protein PRZ48_010065 [Zasmidium cellare]
MTSQRYHYEPLDSEHQQIRILKVHATSSCPTTTVHCTLSPVSLLDDPTPEYHTVSYRWGDPRDREYIIVNDAILDVSRRAERLLRRFRREDEDVTLWIDAICINQQDDSERAQQVAMMGEIYSTSLHGYIWLGNETESTALAIEGIEAIVEDARRETDDFRRFYEKLYTDGGDFGHSSDPLRLRVEKFVPALIEFFAFEWFGRLWIVQEAVIAPSSTCYVGDLEIRLPLVLTCAAWMSHKNRYLPFDPSQSSGMWNACSIWNIAAYCYHEVHSVDPFKPQSKTHMLGHHGPGRSNEAPFLALVNNLRGFRASDPRDHMFALIGLYRVANQGRELPKSLLPDYRKSVIQVFRDSTMYGIQETGTLDVLREVKHRSSDFEASTFETPSWVPRWQEGFDVTQDFHALRPTFRADRHRENVEFASEAIHPGVLSVRGIRIGTVACVVKTSRYGRLTARHGLHTISVLRSALGLAARASGKTMESEALAMTMCADADSGLEPLGHCRAVMGLRTYIQFLLEGGELPRNLPPQRTGQTLGTSLNLEDDETTASEFHHNWQAAHRNRRLFVTHEGHLGLASLCMSSRDIIVVLYGSKWPVVLRPVPGGYRLVSIAYVHGIMDGEAVPEPGSSDDKSETFHIF